MHPLERLDVSTRVAKRAQYEAFEFAVVDGGVRVRNGSYANPAEHQYHVTVQDGLPTQCECPADERFDGACKHRVAVAIRTPVLDAATRRSVAADGGSHVTDVGDPADAADGPETPDSDEDEPDDCACDELSGEFPCWPCVRTGRRELPE